MFSKTNTIGILQKKKGNLRAISSIRSLQITKIWKNTYSSYLDEYSDEFKYRDGFELWNP